MVDVHQRIDPVAQKANSFEQDVRIAALQVSAAFFNLLGWIKTNFQPLPCIQPAAHCGFVPCKKKNVEMGE